MQQPHILVIDSGIGGLSVTQSIIQHIPSAYIHYIADKRFFPYGNLTEQALESRVEHLVRTALQNTSPDIIVIACNTASTVVLDHLRSQFKIPFVGVVPAIKPAAKISHNKKIAVLATLGTTNRHYTQKLIHEFASDCQVALIATPNLVALAEEKLMGKEIFPDQIQEATQELFLTDKPDTVVLACTHFPLLKTELARVHQDIIHWVDSGEAIARRVKHLIEEAQPQTHSAHPNQFTITQQQPLNSTYHIDTIQSYIGNYTETVLFEESI